MLTNTENNMSNETEENCPDCGSENGPCQDPTDCGLNIMIDEIENQKDTGDSSSTSAEDGTAGVADRQSHSEVGGEPPKTSEGSVDDEDGLCRREEVVFADTEHSLPTAATLRNYLDSRSGNPMYRRVFLGEAPEFEEDPERGIDAEQIRDDELVRRQDAEAFAEKKYREGIRHTMKQVSEWVEELKTEIKERTKEELRNEVRQE